MGELVTMLLPPLIPCLTPASEHGELLFIRHRLAFRSVVPDRPGRLDRRVDERTELGAGGWTSCRCRRSAAPARHTASLTKLFHRSAALLLVELAELVPGV